MNNESKEIINLFENRINSLLEVTITAYELFKDKKETVAWMMKPSDILFGQSPFDICMTGDADKLSEWLEKRK